MHAMGLRQLTFYVLSVDIATIVSERVRSWEAIDQQTLGKQIIRSADSIASNIAEGYGRSGVGDRLNFFIIAEGSCQELVSQVDIARRRMLLSVDEFQNLSNSIRRVSIQLLAIAASVRSHHPEYQGRCRLIVEKRTAWMPKSSQMRSVVRRSRVV